MNNSFFQIIGMWIIVTTFRYLIDDGFDLNDEVAASLARPGPQCAWLIVFMFTLLPIPPRGPRLFPTVLHNAPFKLPSQGGPLGFRNKIFLEFLGSPTPYS